MDQRSDRGLEFVLDNGKLIVGFFVLITVCGLFFVIGFVEGKRQAVGLEAKVLPSQVVQPQQAAAAPSSSPAAKADEERSVREQLDWYRRVNKDAEATKGLEPAPEPVKTVVQPSAPAPTARESVPKPKTAPPKAAAAKQTYSVQVGAFRQRHEAEAKASVLKSRGYEYVIESPAASGSLFLLKVGKFNSKADAAAMQLRLKKDGVGSFIKTNP